jgi:hypothetical protein
MTDHDVEMGVIYSGVAMLGLLINGGYAIEEIPSMAKALAKSMMTEEDGILAIKQKRRKER